MTEPVVIWGAGAIGGTIAAYLARAGHEVLAVDTVEEHVCQIAEHGLRIDGPVADFTACMSAVTPDQVKGQYRLILLAVKAHHTEAATKMLAPHLAADGAVVSCQNGLNELMIADIVGKERTIGAFVNFGADWMGPGHINYGNRGAVVVGEITGAKTPRITALHRLLQEFEPDAVLADDIFAYLWGKIGYGAILKTSALTDDTMAEFIGNPENLPMIRQLVRELLAVAAAEGIKPLGFNGFEPAAFAAGDEVGIAASIAAMTLFNTQSAKQRSGIWRDLAVRRRQTDAAAQLAPAQAAAKQHGLSTPLTDRLVELIGRIEAGKATTSSGLTTELRALASASTLS
jgi:2-dehydropantoate 2-reductase